MKIIKLGKIKQEIGTLNCPKCDAELEVTRADIKKDKDGKYLKCPCCDYYIDAFFIVWNKLTTTV